MVEDLFSPRECQLSLHSLHHFPLQWKNNETLLSSELKFVWTKSSFTLMLSSVIHCYILVFGNLIVQLKKRILNGPGNIFQMANEMSLAVCQKSQKMSVLALPFCREYKHLVIYELLRILWLKVVIIYVPLTILKSPKQSCLAPAVRVRTQFALTFAFDCYWGSSKPSAV